MSLMLNSHIRIHIALTLGHVVVEHASLQIFSGEAGVGVGTDILLLRMIKNKNMNGPSLLSLVSIGELDAHLTMSPSIMFFRFRYDSKNNNAYKIWMWYKHRKQYQKTLRCLYSLNIMPELMIQDLIYLTIRYV